MRKTLLTHFFNEEYLLPWWLHHHKAQFDHGICIDYASTDRSVKIINEICPQWTVVSSINDNFEAFACDAEIIRYEQQIEGWKIALNITEFLIGDFSILNDVENQELFLPSHILVDENPEQIPTYTKPLIEQKHHGISYRTDFSRRARCFHNKPTVVYPVGRHFEQHTCEVLQIFWYGYAPFTPQLIQRKLQIQARIPECNRNQGLGHTHFVTEEQLRIKYASLRNHAEFKNLENEM